MEMGTFVSSYGNKEKELWKKLTLTPFEEDTALQNCPFLDFA